VEARGDIAGNAGVGKANNILHLRARLEHLRAFAGVCRCLQVFAGVCSFFQVFAP
jgi:hypothetical protein